MVQFNNELNKMMVRNKYHIQKCSAITGEGMYEGLEWLNTELLKKKITTYIETNLCFKFIIK